ncbi:glycosyltransferase [Yoonia sp.]|uniref:glycosyltransferase family 4 protein n=1 Tax=Yoonia sp. TaxID=2212373 RepID=UPI002DF76F0D|nr:glycosyltransferase [Yoonia sp.]
MPGPVNQLSTWDFFPIFVAFSISLALSILIVTTSHWHLGRTARGHNGGEVQGIHTKPTPRVGGLTIFGGLLGSALITLEPGGHVLRLLVIASLPVFIVGFLEDLSFGMSPLRRLFAAIASVAIAIILTGAYVHETGITFLDASLDYRLVAVAITLLAVAGMSHGFNLIDGLNGLAGGVTITMAAGLALIALKVGYNEVAMIAIIIIAATVGFLVLNFPGGHLFLGDAGAYTIGFLLSFLAIMLVSANPQVSIFSLILCGFWPFIDTMAAIARRVTTGRSVGEPDRLHFHHLTMRLVKAVSGKKRSKVFMNSFSSFILLPVYSLPVVLAVISYDNLELSAVYLCIMTLLYFVNRLLIFHGIRFVKSARRHSEQELASH